MQQEALIKVVAGLVGKTITSVIRSDDSESVGFSLSDGALVWVDRDPEGNGVGWLNVERPLKKLKIAA